MLPFTFSRMNLSAVLMVGLHTFLLCLALVDLRDLQFAMRTWFTKVGRLLNIDWYLLDPVGRSTLVSAQALL